MTDANEKLPAVDSAAVFRPAAGVAWVRIGEEVVIYRVADAASLVLNATAGLLWQCIDGTGPLADILDDLADAFGVGRAKVENDCVPLLSTWWAENLVEEVNLA